MRTPEGIALRRLVQEITESVLGTRIQRVTFPSEWETSIDLFHPARNLSLLVSTHPECSAFALFPSADRGNPPRTPWQKLLHKYLVGGKIVSFRQMGWDRVVELGISNPSLWERETEFLCIFELTGRNANIILTRNDPQRTILGALRPVTPEHNRFRSILPGFPYTPPPQKKRLDPLTFAQNPVFPETENIAAWCMHNLDGFGPFLAGAFAELAEHLGQELALRSILKPLTGNCPFFVFLEGDEKPRGVFWERVSLLASPWEYSFPSLNEAMAFLLSAFREYLFETTKRRSSEKALREDLAFVTEELAKIEDLIPKEEDIECLRITGELLKMFPHFDILERTEEGVWVRNLFAAFPETVFIPSSSLNEPGKAMQEYFRQYRKMRERRVRLLAKREELKARLEKLRALLEHPETLEVPLEDPEPAQARKSILRFRTPSGNEIWVGKNAKANRILVRIASRNDYWFHARDFPGAHVILKPFIPESLEEDRKKAAQIAAYFSSGRLEGKVEVVYTQVKHLRLLGGKDGGKTLYQKEETLRVPPALPQDLEAI